jgi:hypothetical protein
VPVLTVDVLGLQPSLFACLDASDKAFASVQGKAGFGEYLAILIFNQQSLIIDFEDSETHN